MFLAAQQDELSVLRNQLDKAQKGGNRDSIAAACAYLSEYYAYRQADSARYYCLRGLEYARKDQVEPYIPLLVNLAVTYDSEGDMSEAVRRLSFANSEAVRLHAPVEYRISVLTSLGVTYRHMEKPDSTLHYYNKALLLLEDSDDYVERTYLLTCIAILYANTSRPDEAETYARRAMKAAEQCNDMDMVFYAATTAGAIFRLQGKGEEAVAMLRPAIGKARMQQKPLFVLKGMTYLINVFSDMHLPDSVEYYMRQAEQVKRSLPDNSIEVLGYEETRYKVLTALGRYRESLAVQYKLLELRDINAQTPIERFYLDMARNYEGLHEYARAAEYYEKAYLTADSLHREQINADLSEWSVKYETQEKELEITRLRQEQLQQEAKKLRWSIIAVTAVFILMGWIVYYVLRRKRVKKEEELKLAQRYIAGMEGERARLAKDLHDGVCNDLLGIGMQLQSLSPDADSKARLLGLIEQARADVRHISHELMPPKFQYITLPEAIEDYVGRMSVPSFMQIVCESSPHVDWTQVPEKVSYEVYRILQEQVSNVVQHTDATEVTVRLTLANRKLCLEVTDNGHNSMQARLDSKGIGRSTIRERVKALGGILSVEEREGRHCFTLCVSL